MFQPPNPIVTCARCLWSIGYGYDRIARLLFGNSQGKYRIYKWRKYHQWPGHPHALGAYYRMLSSRPRVTTPTSQSLEEKERRQQERFSKRTKKQLRQYLSTQINQCLKHGFYPNATTRLVSCSPTELKAHLQSLFQAEMDWSNYGTYWEIDHIKAVHHFDIHDPVERKTCYHFTNLQPLTRHQNRKKFTK